MLQSMEVMNLHFFELQLPRFHDDGMFGEFGGFQVPGVIVATAKRSEKTEEGSTVCATETLHGFKAFFIFLFVISSAVSTLGDSMERWSTEIIIFFALP